MCNALTAIVKVISLKWVVHNTNLAKIVTCIIKKENTPVFQAYSCSMSLIPKYNFLNKWKKLVIITASTPLSCNQKKSSI